MTALFDRLTDTRKEWFQKGNEIWTDLQGKSADWLVDLNTRRGQLVDRGQEALAVGQKALSSFEVNAFERTTDFLTWAYTITGERSDAIRKTMEFIGQRLDEADVATEDEFDATKAPFADYDDLNAKTVCARLEGLPARELEWVSAYEAANKNRKTVIDGVSRLLADA